MWESRCRRDTGPALRQAAWEKNISSSAEASARNELLLRRGSSQGRAPKNACVGGTSVNTFFSASRLPLPPPRCGNAATLSLCGPWMWASDTTPGYWAQAHTRPRCVRVDAPILPCLRGGSQKYSRNAPRAESLTARGLPLVERACGR